MKTKRLEFFEKDPIPWTGKNLLHEFYKTMLSLKANNAALRGGDPAAKTYLLKTSADNKVLAYVRKNGKDEVLTVLNFSEDEVSFTIEDENVTGIFKNVFSGPVKDFSKDKSFYLPVGGYAVMEK